jgi:UDP-N-acetylmuramoyl-L-alanyl-D-glutamate--2,6-diaminopimelate ligase
MSLGIKNIISYGIKSAADVSAALIDSSLTGLVIDIAHKGRIHRVRSRLIGEYNSFNITACFAAGMAMGIDDSAVVKGIEDLAGIRGRLEQVAQNIFVDFAHTPRALESVLSTLRKYTAGRLIIIFGCGGDRDRDKRPKMGKIASHLADLVILTSDNPRTEPPLAIIDEIRQGFRDGAYKVIPDRREAIGHGIGIRKEQDILLIAGKGHEETQTLKDRAIPFDDAQVARECLRS